MFKFIMLSWMMMMMETLIRPTLRNIEDGFLSRIGTFVGYEILSILLMVFKHRELRFTR